MNAAEFDAYTRGKTLYYGHEGEVYGVEQYLEGRRVIWSFLDGQCRHGVWFEDEGLICFVYEHEPNPQCWAFSLTGDRLVARFEDSAEPTELYDAQDTDDGMLCYGPDVGV